MSCPRGRAFPRDPRPSRMGRLASQQREIRWRGSLRPRASGGTALIPREPASLAIRTAPISLAEIGQSTGVTRIAESKNGRRRLPHGWEGTDAHPCAAAGGEGAAILRESKRRAWRVFVRTSREAGEKRKPGPPRSAGRSAIRRARADDRLGSTVPAVNRRSASASTIWIGRHSAASWPDRNARGFRVPRRSPGDR